MANQPKKYKKFVATAATATLVASAIVPVASAASLSDISGNTHEEAINALVDAGVINGYPDGTFKPNKELTRSDVVKLLGKYLEAEGYAPASTWKTSPAFADLKTTSNEELLKYASVVKEAGVFVGSNGNLLPGDLITRENMALTLVRMVNTLKDLSLEEFVAGQDFNGDVEDTNQAKAEARSAIAVLDFFDITNPAVSNFNPKGNTTRGQFATFLYKTANTDFGKAPSNEASEVVPTSVELVEKSTQGQFGENVTLTAKVTAKPGESLANIPVTFAINPGSDELLQPQIKDEVLTNADGVATYTYTRYKNKTNNFTDSVVAYASAKQGVRDVSAVYWGTSLKVSDVTEATTLANGEQKVYQVTGTANSYVYVTFKENLNVKPDTAIRTAYLQGTAYTQDAATDTTTIDTVGVVWTNPEDASQHTPYLLDSGVYSSGVVRLDETGKANIVVTGKNAEVTPIVYSAPGTSKIYDETLLQATASKVKFEAESLFNLSVESKGSQNAAYEYSPEQYGGRDYTVTLKGTDGKVMPNATVKVGFDEKAGTLYADQVSVYDADGEEVDPTGTTGIYELTTDKDGQVTFTVTGSINNYATPIVFIGKSLTDYEIQTKGEIAYFGGVKASNYTSVLKVTNEALENNKEVSTFGNGETATFTYQLSDQNGKPRSYANANLPGNGSTTVTFTVRAGAKPVTVTTADGVNVDLAAYETRSFTKSISSTATNTNIEVTGEGASEVRVTATPTNSGLSGLTSITQRVNFLAGASTSYFTVSNVSATATSIDSVTLTFTEAVTSNDIFVNVTGASVTANSASNNKVLYVYFNDAANKPAARNGQFTIAYKGKTYVVTTDADGKLNVAAR